MGWDSLTTEPLSFIILACDPPVTPDNPKPYALNRTYSDLLPTQTYSTG